MIPRIAVLGFSLMSLSCTNGEHAPNAPVIFWLDYLANSVHRANADGTGATIIVSGQDVDNPDGVVVDTAAGKVYWTNMDDGGPSGSVQRSNLDGSEVEFIIARGRTHTPKQIAMDPAGGKIYWSDRDGSRIQRSNLDGSGLETLIESLQRPVGMALDVGSSKMYWSDKEAGKIQRAGMEMPDGETSSDRTDVEDLIGGLQSPIDIDLDLTHGKLYWTDRDGGTIQRANLEIPAGDGPDDRPDIEILVENLSTPIGLSLDPVGRKMYYTELAGPTVARANLDGSGQQVLVEAETLGLFTGICFAQLPAEDRQ